MSDIPLGDNCPEDDRPNFGDPMGPMPDRDAEPLFKCPVCLHPDQAHGSNGCTRCDCTASAIEPLNDSPPPALLLAVEHLIDDYGLDNVRAALAELIEWYADAE